MASLLYSLSRIWPLSSTASNLEADQSSIHSEAGLENLSGQSLPPATNSSSRNNIKQTLSTNVFPVSSAAHNICIHPNASIARQRKDKQKRILQPPETPDLKVGHLDQGNGNATAVIGPKIAAGALIRTRTTPKTAKAKAPAQFLSSLEPSSLPPKNTQFGVDWDLENSNTISYTYREPDQAREASYQNSQLRGPQPTMWEDSGYESPILRSQIRPQEKQPVQPAATVLPISQASQNQLHSSNSFLSIANEESLARAKRLLLLERYSGSTPTTPAAQPKLYGKTSSTVVQEFGQSYLNESGIGELGPAYTSTPIKSSTEHRYGGYGAFPAYPCPSPSYQRSSPIVNISRSNKNDLSQTGRSSSCGRLEGTADTENGNINKILQETSHDFHGKYSQWIEQIFQLQAEKIQRRLQVEFNQNIEDITRQKDHEILEMQQSFRDRLGDFESSTEKFQNWVETLAEENNRIRAAKDTIITELEKSATEQRENLQVELEKQINDVQAACEREKLELQKKHADQIRSVNEKSMAHLRKHEEHFLGQIDSLKKQNEFLQQEKNALENQVDSYRKTNVDPTSLQNLYANYLREREELVVRINQLMERISMSEKEKENLISLHNAKFLNAQAESEKAVETLSSQMASSQQVAQELIQRYEDENYRLKQDLRDQELQYMRMIDDLKLKYGQKIDNLAETVESLQCQLFKQE